MYFGSTNDVCMSRRVPLTGRESVALMLAAGSSREQQKAEVASDAAWRARAGERVVCHFSVETSEESLLLDAGTPRLAEEWVAKIAAVVESIKGSRSAAALARSSEEDRKAKELARARLQRARAAISVAGALGTSPKDSAS